MNEPKCPHDRSLRDGNCTDMGDGQDATTLLFPVRHEIRMYAHTCRRDCHWESNLRILFIFFSALLKLRCTAGTSVCERCSNDMLKRKYIVKTGMLLSQVVGRRVKLSRSQYPPLSFSCVAHTHFPASRSHSCRGREVETSTSRKRKTHVPALTSLGVTQWRKQIFLFFLLHLLSCSVCRPFFVSIASFRSGSTSPKTSMYPSYTIRQQDSQGKRHNGRTTRLWLLLPFSLTRDSQT